MLLLPILITRWGNWGWKYFYQRHSASQRPWRQLPVSAIFHSFYSPFRGMCAKRPQDLEGAGRSQLENAYMEALPRRHFLEGWAAQLELKSWWTCMHWTPKTAGLAEVRRHLFQKNPQCLPWFNSLDREEAGILISAWFSVVCPTMTPSILCPLRTEGHEVSCASHDNSTRMLVSSLTGQVEGQENTAAKFMFSAWLLLQDFVFRAAS